MAWHAWSLAASICSVCSRPRASASSSHWLTWSLAWRLAASTAAAIGLNKYLREIDELRAKLRVTSDKLTTVLGTGAMTADTILDEQKLQLALAKLEGRENADVLETYNVHYIYVSDYECAEFDVDLYALDEAYELIYANDDVRIYDAGWRETP